MSNQIPIKTRSGEIVYVEIEGAPAVHAPRGAQDGATPTDPAALSSPDPYREFKKGGAPMDAAGKVLQEGVFAKVIGVMRGLVEEVGAGLMEAEPKPSQVDLELSLGLGASGNVVLFKGSADATFKLKMTWKS